MGFKINRINFHVRPEYRLDHKSEASSSLKLFLRIPPLTQRPVSLKNSFQKKESDDKVFALFKRGAIPRDKKVSLRHFEEALHQKNLIACTRPRCALEPEEKEELFEIAHLVEKCKIREAVSRFNRLPDTQKGEIKRHLVQLGSHPPSVITNLFKTQQALFATAFENDNYFSKREVARWFRELTACLQEDALETRQTALFP
jgi:hypothetical protein